jgi:hypothetical protein
MANRNQTKRAEDILSDDELIEQLTNQNFLQHQISADEIELSRNIEKSLSMGKKTLLQDDIDRLGLKIIDSIRKSKRRMIRMRYYGAAAILLFLFGMPLFFFLSQSSDKIEQYASQISLYSNKTELLLLNQKIQIPATESKIEYSTNGAKIKIDTERQIDQSIKPNTFTYNAVVVPYGKRTIITLPDQTKIWLNSGSKLVFPATFASDKRQVYLDGEAMFEVNHNQAQPFFVITKNLKIKVLGTIFNLCAYHDDKTVSAVLESGSVEILYDSHSLFGEKEQMMIPGMMAVLDLTNKSIVQTKVDTRNYTSWKDGYLILKKSTLRDIVKKLSRYYNENIAFEDPGIAEETFSGQLDLRNSAMQVLDVISEMVDIEIVRTGHQILIRKKRYPV